MFKSWKNAAIGAATIVATGAVIAVAAPLIGVAAGTLAIGLGVAVAAAAVGFAAYKGYQAAFEAKTQQQKYKDIEGVGEGIGVAADTAALTIAGNAAGGVISDALASRASAATAAAAGDTPYDGAAWSPPVSEMTARQSSGYQNLNAGSGANVGGSGAEITAGDVQGLVIGSSGYFIRETAIDGAVAILREQSPELFDTLSVNHIKSELETMYLIQIKQGATPNASTLA